MFEFTLFDIESVATLESRYPPELPMDPYEEDEYDGTLSLSNNLNDNIADNSTANYSSSNDESSSGS